MKTELTKMLLVAAMLSATASSSWALPPRQHAVRGVIDSIDQSAHTLAVAPANGSKALVFVWKDSRRFKQGWSRFCSGALQIRFGFKQLGEQRRAGLAEALGDEDRLQRGLVELRLRAVQGGGPSIQRREHRDTGLAQLDASVMPHDVLRMLKEREQFRHGPALDEREVFHDRLRVVHRPPDATVLVVPMWVAHWVLRVANDSAAEVRNVERAIEAEGNIGGPERGVR